MHLQSLAPTPVSRRVDVRQAAGRKNNGRIFITTWWKKNVVPNPNKGRKRYQSRFTPEDISDISTRHLSLSLYQRDLAMGNIADVTDGKPIAVHLMCECYWSLSHLLRHLWKKGTGAILLFSPGYHTTPWPYELHKKLRYSESIYCFSFNVDK
jgi:hypothetical protein